MPAIDDLKNYFEHYTTLAACLDSKICSLIFYPFSLKKSVNKKLHFKKATIVNDGLLI
jgi:hypothetical protein